MNFNFGRKPENMPDNQDTENPSITQERNDLNDPQLVIAALQAQLLAANARADEEHEQFLRERASFINFKRRTEEEKDSLKQYLTREMLFRLLNVVDNFELSLAAAAQTREFEKLVSGVDKVYQSLLQFLEKEGVTPIEAKGEPFNPEFHNAILREENAELPEETVLTELQRGYTMGDKVLRPTLVKVSTVPESALPAPSTLGDTGQ
jgi:molecular chaperone GrpE